MNHKILFPIINWWKSQKITEKFGVVFLFLLVIGVIQTTVSITGFQVIGKSVDAAQISLETQRLSLEISRDWESMRNYEYRFFSQYQSIGFSKAKEQYAIPAGEKLSDIIRTGAALRRLTSAPDASDNLRYHDAVLQQFLFELSQYAAELESAVQMAEDSKSNQEENIQNKQMSLNLLAQSIQPHFTRLILMAQNEVVLAREQVRETEQSVISFLLLANALVIVLVSSIIMIFRKILSNSVSQLTNASGRIQAGHWDERVKNISGDEFGIIGAAFNQMAESIQERTQALQEIDFRYQALFNQSNDAVLLVGLDGHIQKANQRALNMYGYSLQEMIQMDIHEMISEEGKQLAKQTLEDLAAGADLPVFEFIMRKKDGSFFPVEINFTRVLDEFGNALYFQSIARDISERKEIEEQLRYMAMFDSLTGLPNRAYLYAHLAHEIKLAAQNRNMLAILFMDLDGFKQVNDNFGHEQGDQLLKLVGQKLQESIRKSDLVARVGGDEFIVILQLIHKTQDVSLIAQKIINNLAEPFYLNEGTVQITTSLGISLYPNDGEKIEQLIQYADQAMYRVKGLQKNGYQFFGNTAPPEGALAKQDKTF